VDKMGAGMRPSGKPMESPPYPKMLRALHFYPDLERRESLTARQRPLAVHVRSASIAGACNIWL